MRIITWLKALRAKRAKQRAENESYERALDAPFMPMPPKDREI